VVLKNPGSVLGILQSAELLYLIWKFWIMILQNYVIGLLPLGCLCGNCGVDYRFSETLEGVVLAYDVQIQDDLAKILPALHPYFGVSLKAKLLLFAPKPNMLLGS
jgi:hypothetical protein